MNDYLNRITNYIFDGRFTRALMIDGDWGCGKSYFVKHTLINEIERTEVRKAETVENAEGSNDSRRANRGNATNQKKPRYYKALLISLYGISKVEDIQSFIYTACIDKFAEKTQNDKTAFAIRNAAIFGTNVIKGVGEFFNVEDSTHSILSKFGEEVLSLQKEEIVLVFDDVERCQISIIELMGFLNNLCENNDYRIILIANENEISRQRSEIAEAIQSQIALIDLGIKTFSRNEKNQSKSGESRIIDALHQIRISNSDDGVRQELIAHREKLFEKNNLYERTREKLIGLTIRFEANLVDVYEDILNTTIDEGDVRDYLFNKKEFIVEVFENQSHKNLRTLISLFIAADRIFSVLEVQTPELTNVSKDVEVDKIIEEEKSRVLTNLIITAISMTNGKEPSRLSNNVRYGLVGNALLIDKRESYLKYTFVDEYWEKLTVNADVVNEDFNNRLGEVLKDAVERVRNKEHYELALFRLKDWYYHPDEDVQADVIKLKKELEDKKYDPSEFKSIICTLMCINDAGFGMSLEPVDYYSTNPIYDALADIAVDTNEKSGKYDSIATDTAEEFSDYKHWDQENIEEYVGLMLKYTKDPQFCMDKEMLRFITEDKKFARRYRAYIQPLLNWLNEREMSELKESEDGKDLFEMDSKDYFSFFSNRKNTFFTNGKCLSLYSVETLEDMIRTASAKNVSDFARAIHEVYKIGNIRSFLADDYNVINQIWLDLRNDRESKRLIFNKKRSRTKEIALRRLESDFHLYRDALRDPKEIIEENIKLKESEQKRRKA